MESTGWDFHQLTEHVSMTSPTDCPVLAYIKRHIALFDIRYTWELAILPFPPHPYYHRRGAPREVTYDFLRVRCKGPVVPGKGIPMGLTDLIPQRGESLLDCVSSRLAQGVTMRVRGMEELVSDL